jgi:uncharacterized protein YdeI (YjbR/CyaY-like superfamily)
MFVLAGGGLNASYNYLKNKSRNNLKKQFREQNQPETESYKIESFVSNIIYTNNYQGIMCRKKPRSL